ncbi:hypothetical protein [Streptomyces sp. NPDC046821]|uniref:hypothetical protein n=1 Tax=Streptomyces sp. NPDC046821 TaxID=3154702 RepID=UPI0033CBA937
MGCDTAGFGRDLGIDLVHGSVAVFEDVVLIVEFGEPLGQGQLMSVALVYPEGELPRRELSGDHTACEGSGGGFLTGLAADRTEGEAEFGECCGKQVVDVVVRLGARASGEDPQTGAVSPATSASQAALTTSPARISPILQRAAWSCKANCSQR